MTFDQLDRHGLSMLADMGRDPLTEAPWGGDADARDALNRPLPNDWLQACAQARQARLLIERRHILKESRHGA